MAEDMDKVLKKGEIKFALTGQYPPFNFVDKNNNLAGFDVEIGKEIAKRIGVKGVPITIAWDGIIAGLLAKKYELICGSMAITPKRLKSIDFSDPYYRSGAQLFVGKNSTINSVNDLKGKKIGKAMISRKHSNWIINLNNAKAKDVINLISLSKERVKKKFNIDLEEEIVFELFLKDIKLAVEMYLRRFDLPSKKELLEKFQALQAIILECSRLLACSVKPSR